MGNLSKELALSAAQVAGLSEQKSSIRADREIVADCMRQIRSLRAKVASHAESSQRVTDELRRILEPTQVRSPPISRMQSPAISTARRSAR